MKKSNTFLVATLTVALLLASCGNTPEVIIATAEPVIVEVTVAPEVSPTTTEKTPAPLPEGFENLIETYADDGKLPTSAPDLTTGYRISGATFLPGETHVGTFIPFGIYNGASEPFWEYDNITYLQLTDECNMYEYMSSVCDSAYFWEDEENNDGREGFHIVVCTLRRGSWENPITMEIRWLLYSGDIYVEDTSTFEAIWFSVVLPSGEELYDNAEIAKAIAMLEADTIWDF